MSDLGLPSPYAVFGIYFGFVIGFLVIGWLFSLVTCKGKVDPWKPAHVAIVFLNGFVGSVLIYAVLKTQGVTMLLPGMVALVCLNWLLHQNNEVILKARKIRNRIVYALIISFVIVLNWIVLVFPFLYRGDWARFPFFDNSYYAGLSVFFKEFGIEQVLVPHFLLDGLRGNTFYHYGDIWANALLIDVSGIGAILSFEAVLIPCFTLFFFFSLLAFAAEVAYKRREVWILSISVLLFFLGKFVVPEQGSDNWLNSFLDKAGYGGVKSMMLIGFLPIWSWFLSQRRGMEACLVLLVPATFFIGYLPALYACSFSFFSLLIYSNWKAKQSVKWNSVLATSLPMVFLPIFYIVYNGLYGADKKEIYNSSSNIAFHLLDVNVRFVVETAMHYLQDLQIFTFVGFPLINLLLFIHFWKRKEPSLVLKIALTFVVFYTVLIVLFGLGYGKSSFLFTFLHAISFLFLIIYFIYTSSPHKRIIYISICIGVGVAILSASILVQFNWNGYQFFQHILYLVSYWLVIVLFIAYFFNSISTANKYYRLFLGTIGITLLASSSWYIYTLAEFRSVFTHPIEIKRDLLAPYSQDFKTILHVTQSKNLWSINWGNAMSQHHIIRNDFVTFGLFLGTEEDIDLRQTDEPLNGNYFESKLPVGYSLDDKMKLIQQLICSGKIDIVHLDRSVASFYPMKRDYFPNHDMIHGENGDLLLRIK